MKDLILDEQGILHFDNQVISKIDTAFLLKLFEDGINGDVTFNIADGQELTKFFKDIKETLDPTSEFIKTYKSNIESIKKTEEDISKLTNINDDNENPNK